MMLMLKYLTLTTLAQPMVWAWGGSFWLSDQWRAWGMFRKYFLQSRTLKKIGLGFTWKNLNSKIATKFHK